MGGWGRRRISCFLAEKLGNTKEKATCLPRGSQFQHDPLAGLGIPPLNTMFQPF